MAGWLELNRGVNEISRQFSQYSGEEPASPLSWMKTIDLKELHQLAIWLTND